jgi:D-inositol-3-phosphate glycosyltransferase
VIEMKDVCKICKENARGKTPLSIAMFSIHSCPVGELGTKDTGGMNVYIRELAGQLGDRGHRVDIYTRVHDPEDPQVIHLNDNARVIHLKAGNNGHMHKLAIYPYLDDFSGALKDFVARNALEYDLIHSHYWLSGPVGRWVQARWNAPHMMMFHTLGAVKNTTGVGTKEPLLRIKTEKQLVAHCDRIIAATAREKTELNRFYSAESQKMRVVPCGVNMDLFQPVEKAYARKCLGFKDNEKIILYVGRFAALKGIDRLLKAMTHLRDLPDLKLVIIGGDGDSAPQYIEFKRLAAELDVNDKIVFAGRLEQNELPQYYGAADLLAVPSYHESFGLVALEALACGTPVVATEVGAMESVICEGKSGRVVADSRPSSFAEAIRNFVSKPLSEMESAASIRASVCQFNWSDIADTMIAEYESMLAEYHHLNMQKTSSAAASI